mgnify:CR=1 FL=1
MGEAWRMNMERTPNEELLQPSGEEVLRHPTHVKSPTTQPGGISLMGWYVPWGTLLPIAAGLVTALGIAGLYWLAPQTSRGLAYSIRGRLAEYGDRSRRRMQREEGVVGWPSRLFG